MKMGFFELRKKDKILKKAAEILKVEPKDLPRVLKRFLNEIDEANKKIQSSMKKNESS